MANRKILGGNALPVWATNTRARQGGAALPVALIDPVTGDFSQLLDATAANALSKLTKNLVLDPLTLTSTKTDVGGVEIVNVAYDAFRANINGDWYDIPAGNIDLNAADVPLPINIYGYVYLDGTAPTVTVNTTSPDDQVALNHNFAWMFVARITSIAGASIIRFLRRAFTAADLFLHYAGEWDYYTEPLWISGGNITIQADDGSINITSLAYRRLRFDGTTLNYLDADIVEDSETMISSVNQVVTYSDGTAVTAGKYVKLLLGSLVGAGGDAPLIIVRQGKPTVEYATLVEAKIDAENVAAASWPTNYQGAVVPIAYIVMLKGDATDLETVDIRATGTGTGGGGGGTTDHGALSGLGDDDHTQYLLIDGTRAMTGALDMGAFAIDNAGPVKSGDVAGGDYSETETDGTLHFVGGATVWRDFNFGVGALGAGASAPDLVPVNGTGVVLYGFDGNVTTEQLYASLEMDHEWKEGSVIYPHIHWMPTTNNAGNVKWQLEYIWVDKNHGAVGASTTITVTADAGGVAWDSRFTNFPTIDGTGKTIGSQMMIRLFRNPADVADTYPNDATVITFGFHVEVDTVGSREIATK